MKRQTFRIIVLCLVSLAGAAFIYLVRSLLVPFIIAVLMAYLVHPPVHHLETRGVSRAKAIMTVYAAGIILAGIFLLLFIPTLFTEAKAFENILPVYSKAWVEAQDYLNRFSAKVMLPPEVRQILLEMYGRIRNGLFERMRGFAESLLGLIALLPSFLLSPFLAYYIIKDFDHFKKRFLAIIPSEYRSELVRFIREADLIFSRFLRGHLLISALVGFLTGVGAALIGLQFFLLIGIFTALANLIPFFGPFIAAFPVVGLAFIESPLKGFLMLAIYLFVQQLEGCVLTPRLLGDRMGLHPLAVIFVLLVGGYFFGALGLIFAVPVACLLRVGLRSLWDRLIGAS